MNRRKKFLLDYVKQAKQKSVKNINGRKKILLDYVKQAKQAKQKRNNLINYKFIIVPF